MKMRVLDLFSGIGGFSLGLERTGGFETAAFCEYEPFARAVLAKHWPDVPCFPDVRELKGSEIDGPIDVICGGYPCQPFSTAGKRRGKEDDRHLWPEFNRLVAELRPTWVIGENVAGHISMGLDGVLSDLEGQGYACRAFVIPACAVDAPHRRDRVWTVAHRAELQRNGSGEHWQPSERQVPQSRKRSGAELVANAERMFGIKQPKPAMQRGRPRKTEQTWMGGGTEFMSDATSKGLQGTKWAQHKGRGIGPSNSNEAIKPGKWLPEPNVGRVANGVPTRVDRLKALGNAVVPQIPEMIGRAILQSESATS